MNSIAKVTRAIIPGKFPLNRVGFNKFNPNLISSQSKNFNKSSVRSVSSSNIVYSPLQSSSAPIGYVAKTTNSSSGSGSGGCTSKPNVMYPFFLAAAMMTISVEYKCDGEISFSSTLNERCFNEFTNNGENQEAIALLKTFDDIRIPLDKKEFMTKEFNKFLQCVNSQSKTDKGKMKAVELYIKGYKQFFLHYETFPSNLKSLYSDPAIMEKCNYQFYHITGISSGDKGLSDGLFFHQTKPSEDSLAQYNFYKNSVKNLGKSGITALGEGRNKIHIPWSLAASKSIMKCLENSRNASAAEIEKKYVGSQRAEKIEALDNDYRLYVVQLSNSVLKLVVWALIVDDIPDSMSKEMPKNMNETILHAMKLISDVNTRKRSKMENHEAIFSIQSGELDAIKKSLEEISNEDHRKACERYVEGAYTSFHSAWDFLADLEKDPALATLNEDVALNLRIDFTNIMNSFQHALDVNYDPKPFNIQKAEDVHYGMHIVVFFEMALSLSEALKVKHTGTSYIGSKSDDYLQLFRRQSLLMQELGSIANLVCTGVSREGNVSRELSDGDFSNQLIFDALHKLSKGSDTKELESLKSLLNELTVLKEENRKWFLEHGSSDNLNNEAKKSKLVWTERWDKTVNDLSKTIEDALPDLFDKWISLYNSLKNYDENEQVSDDAVIFLFQNIIVRGKL